MTRQRYLAIKIESTQPIDEKEFKQTVWNTISRLFGEYGASKTGLVVVEYDANKNRAILRCANVATEIIRASLTSITEIDTKPAAVHVIRASGTLKSLHKNLPHTNK
ncbi:MAG: Rpp14/Pop5 family protein [Candidatus Bathyarchaeia archaeon]|jgi:RNase P/RNase MRP subunit POP5|nr:Rpp14/Pop5 family protein [Candidatus Bathyarchaeota archaeon]